VVADQAMTCRGLAAGVAAWFGREAVLELVDWNEFEQRVGSEHAAVTLAHIDRSIAAGTERSRAILGYAPRYSSLEAVRESLHWLVEHGQADVAGQSF
jgi:nucleoside-diphosphate-sugar epimerase